jgi:hypothetical protein
MSKKGQEEPSLHDWLALGDLEVAFDPEKRNEEDLDRRNDEIRRLPLLLRILSASQPLSSIPSITQDTKSVEGTTDPLVDDVVSRIEDVAATYSEAEGVDALTSHHAPSICRKISRLSPLKREKRKRQWKIQDLASVAASPVGGSPRKKRRQSSGGLLTVGEEIQANDNESENEEVSSDDDMSVEDDADNAAHGQRSDTRVEARAASADSQEAMTTRCLTEIASLVVASLEPFSQNKEDEEGSPSSLSLSITTDSLLSGPASGLHCHLGATLSALMHHSPVLRNRHVAASIVVETNLTDFHDMSSHIILALCFIGTQNALCRAAAPQAAVLIERMGANDPLAVPCLLCGCIDAFISATDDARSHFSITNSAKASVRALARLSHRESYRVRSTLQQSKVMVDVQLELAIGQDSIAVACLLNEHLSRCVQVRQDETANTADRRHEDASTQFASDSPSDTPYSRMRGYQSTDSQIDRTKATSLEALFKDNEGLLRQSFACILNAVGDLVETNPIVSGHTILLLRALSFLLLFGGTWTSDSVKDMLGSNSIGDAAKELVTVWNAIFPVTSDANDGIAPKSEKDQCFRVLVCACLITHARAASACQGDDLNIQEAKQCFECIFEQQCISLRSNVFVSRFTKLLELQDGARAYSLVLETLTGETSTTPNKILEDAFLETCKVVSSRLDLDSAIARGTTDASAMEDLSALLLSVELYGSYNRVEELVQSILNDPLKCNEAMHTDRVDDLIQAAVVAATKHERVGMPHVLPVQLQSLALKVDWREVGTRTSQPSLESQFLLQLFYCMCFLDQEPTSPFAIDPREFPLKEALHLCKSAVDHSVLAHLECRMKELIEKLAPEVCSQIDLPLTRKAFTTSYDSLSIKSVRRTLCRELSECIRACKRDQNQDPSGCEAEHVFAYTSRQLAPNELQVTVVRSLLASPNVPLPFFTYNGLCKDPLAVFKAPLSVWRCKGLRRIALFVLARLLEANELIIVNASPTEGAALELLASRDAIVVRCLIMAAVGVTSGKEYLSPFYCSMTIAMIRSMVAKRHGLLALLVKQEQNDTLIADFMVNHVPESLQDAESLTMLLSERSLITAAEKLVTADASLRIAIAHGHKDERAAKTLTYAALTRLVSSFFLVLGPVGVPVNALGEEDGTDVTQVCRMATFRMLSAMQSVRGSREGLRNECSMALQKLAGLCKGESILNGAGPDVSLRKKLLRDIYEAVAKAANSMGASLSL